jgi:hypothetical protein
MAAATIEAMNRRILAVVWGVAGAGGCAPSILDDCRTDADCAAGVCDQGYCVPAPTLVGPCAGAEALGPLYTAQGAFCDTVRTIARWSPGDTAGTAPDALSTAPLTVEVWVRVAEGLPGAALVSTLGDCASPARSGGWQLELVPAGDAGYAPRLRLGASDTVVEFPGAPVIAGGALTHVAVVFEGSGAAPSRTWVSTTADTRTDATDGVSLSAAAALGPLRFGLGVACDAAPEGLDVLAARVLTGALSPAELAAAPAPEARDLKPD